VAALVRNAHGRLLLQQKSSGEGWSLPAGAIEPGETPEEALRREVLEETGLAVVPQSILGVFGGDRFRHVYPNGATLEYTIVLYRCTVTAEVTTNLDAETQALQYFALAEMPRLVLPFPMELLFGGR
jgi:8-oxo-dGTP pyrophosphatase MutT (NUDIX family)